MQELESNLSYCYTQILTNLQCIEHYLNLIAFKQNLAEITTTCTGTRRKVETFKKNILIFSHAIVFHPNIYTYMYVHICMYVCMYVYMFVCIYAGECPDAAKFVWGDRGERVNGYY